jgi:hypothetical protein
MDILRQAGFSGQGLKMAYAIAMAESSGNARAHNPNAGTGDNSYGLFQINMLGGMGPERRRRYGLKSNEALFDPLTNARVAFKMSNGGRNWGPWSTYGSGAYKKFYGGSGATVSNSGPGGYYTGSGVGGDPVVPKLSEKELAEQYGFTMSFLNANPELKKIFKKMVSEGWSKDMFQAKMRGTKWWKTHSEKEREYLIQRFTDPATAKQSMSQANVRVRQIANQLGIKETKFTKKKMQEAAYNLVAKGWDEGQLRYYLGQYVYFDGGDMEGEGAEIQNELRAYAYQMGVTKSGQWYADQTRKVLRGIATINDYKNEMLRQAKAAFPQYSKQLDGGQTVADIAQPYMQSMAQILELPQGSINLYDTTIKKALQYKNPSTLKNQTKPLWQFENELRSDPRWKKTKNAQDSLMQVGHQVLADFGFKY